MRQTNKQIKTAARGHLLGHYKLAIGAMVLSELIVYLLDMPFSDMTQEGIDYLIVSRMLMGIVGSFVVTLIATLFAGGVARIHLQIAKKEQTGIKELFFAFRNRPDRYIGYSILLALVAVICCAIGFVSLIFLTWVGFLFLLAGLIVFVVIALSWSMVIYLLIEDADITVMDAIRKSNRMMKGRKVKLLGLYLSFIGWLLFSILTLFIGLLWIMPYIAQSLAHFYLDAKAVG